MIWKHTARRWPVALALLALGALALAGCGGGGSSSSSSESTTASNSSGSNASGGFNISDEQRACLKEKGVELPEFKGGEGSPPPGGKGGEPPEGFEPPEGGEMPEGGPPSGGKGGEKFKEQSKAFEECGVELGEFKGGPGGKPDLNSASSKKQIKEYAACVRKNGYELAEPNLSGEGPVFEKSESESAAFKQASAKCQALLGES